MEKTIFLAALIIGMLFDFLFWDKKAGISFPIYTLVWVITSAFYLAKMKARMNGKSILLLVCLLFFSAMSSIRLEPFTTILNIGLVLVLGFILTATYQSGFWDRFGLFDYLTHIWRQTRTFIALPLFTRRSFPRNDEAHAKDEKRGTLFAILRGILLTLPIAVFFSILLARSDPVFSELISNLSKGINMVALREASLRIFVVLFFGNAFLALLIYAKEKSADRRLFQEGGALIRPFLGSIETHIILGSVLLLFSVFVGVQFRYFFFGQANITAAAYTFSEYARRGFGELLAVSLISLLLIYILGLVGKNEGDKSRRVNLLLNLGLVVAVLIMLVSAFQRLSLYEQAFGFTRLRLLAHVFMVWLGFLLAGVVLIIYRKNMRLFINLVLAALLGFGVTLNLINVDATIAKLNIQNTTVGNSLDNAYLETLSFDAVPVLVRAAQEKTTPPIVKEDLAKIIPIFEGRLMGEKVQKLSWQSFHWSRWNAGNMIAFFGLDQ